MPIDPRVNEFPRMLFKGKADTCVVQNADEKSARLAEGWVVRLLPGESPEDYAPTESPKKGRRGDAE